MKLRAIIIFCVALHGVARAQSKRPMYANWSEQYASLQVIEDKSANTRVIIGLGLETRFEKHSMINQISYLQKSKDEPSVTNYSYGYSFGPDWDLPFEPRVDVKAGLSLIQSEGLSKTLNPSGAVKLRINTLKIKSLSLNLFLEAGTLGSNIGYYSTGLSINFGGAE